MPADASRSALYSFAVTFVLALYYRHEPATHARFMISTGIAMIGAALARVFMHWVFEDRQFALHMNYLCLELVCLGLVLNDVRGKVRRSPFLVVLALIGLNHFYWYTAADLGIWRSLAEALYALPPLAPWSAG